MPTNEQLAAELEYLKAAMHELLRRVPGPLATEVQPSDPQPRFQRFPDGPRVVEVKPNVRMRLVAPVCEAYEPPYMAEIFGMDWDKNPENGYPFVHEPSNAPDGMPARSDSGYPLRYVNGEVFMLNANGQFKTEGELVKERQYREEMNARSAAEWGARYGK